MWTLGDIHASVKNKWVRIGWTRGSFVIPLITKWEGRNQVVRVSVCDTFVRKMSSEPLKRMQPDLFYLNQSCLFPHFRSVERWWFCLVCLNPQSWFDDTVLGGFMICLLSILSERGFASLGQICLFPFSYLQALFKVDWSFVQVMWSNRSSHQQWPPWPSASTSHTPTEVRYVQCTTCMDTDGS